MYKKSVQFVQMGLGIRTMISALHAAVSGVQAASRSLAARADNIANARTTARVGDVVAGPSPDDGVFRPYRVVNIARGDGGGVRTAVREADPSHVVIHDPHDVRSDTHGRVALPNVSLEEELVGMTQDRHLFRASLSVVRTADEMAGVLLDGRI